MHLPGARARVRAAGRTPERFMAGGGDRSVGRDRISERAWRWPAADRASGPAVPRLLCAPGEPIGERGPPRRASDPPTGPPEVDFVRDVHRIDSTSRACSWGAPDRRPGQRRSSIRSWHANGRRDGRRDGRGDGRATGGRRRRRRDGRQRTRADAHGPRDATRRAIAGPPRNWMIVPEPIRAPGRCGPPRPGPPASGPRRSRSRPAGGRRPAAARSCPR